MPVSPQETRASLILRLQNEADVAAWDEFVGIYGPVIFRAATRRGFQQADADNLVQEVLLAVAQSVSRWLERDDRGSFRHWLLSLARNHAVDMLAKRATRSLGDDGSKAQRVLNEMPVVDEIGSLIDLEYRRSVFQWAARQIQTSVTESTWRAFWLTHVEGLSVQQAADELQARPGNIYLGRSRVMARIRKLVDQYEESNG